MNFTSYDKALVERIRDWVGDSNITITEPNTLFIYRSHVDQDNLKLPLISLTRGRITIENTNKQPKSSQGLTTEMGEDGKLYHLRTIPIKINYQIDILTRFREECDNIVREFIFKIVNNPELSVPIEVNGNKNTHKFSIHLSEDVEDNSDIASHLDKGEYFRETLSIYTNNAQLFSYVGKTPLSIDVDVDAKFNRRGDN